MITAFIHGLLLSFSLILPLGVQNIFVFNQGATQHKLFHAAPSILTAALCDTLLICLAILGVSLLVLHVVWLKTLIFIIGLIFLLYMGWITWKARPRVGEDKPVPVSAKRQIVYAMSVSLLNPHAIIDTVGVIGVNSIHYSGKAKLAYTFACILVSFCWFISLAFAGHRLHKIDKNGFWLHGVNKLSALIIWSVAIYIGYNLLISNRF